MHCLVYHIHSFTHISFKDKIILTPLYQSITEFCQLCITTSYLEEANLTIQTTLIPKTLLITIVIFQQNSSAKQFLLENFGSNTHLRSAIFCSTEEERKQAQQSKIRRQMKLNRRILTKINLLSKQITSNCEFFVAENQHQKYYLQKHYRLCESLSLRSTEQFVESYLACKLNGVLALDGEVILEKLPQLTRTCLLPKQCKSTCDEIIQDLKTTSAHGSTIT
nr:uncharacterized protein LOC101255856 isoform X2 [Solanum lycopersicum]